MVRLTATAPRNVPRCLRVADPFVHRRDCPPRTRPPGLEHYIAGEIAKSSERRITFDRYMEIALHAPRGYYATRAMSDGEFVDFSTDPEEFSPHFGNAVGAKIHSLWLTMGRPDCFSIVAMGEGSGVMIRDILNFLREKHRGSTIKQERLLLSSLLFWLISSEAI